MPSAQRNQEITRCPVCDTPAAQAFMEVRDVPVFCNMLWNSREKALNAAAGQINLVFCHRCGHVFNAAFDSRRMHYGPRYETSLHYSPAFRKYAVDQAQQLIRSYDLRGKNIIEIGCGKGDFLRLLAELGANRCLGFDPSHDPRSVDQDPRTSRFAVIRDDYSEKYSSYHADLMVCRQVLEHIREPKRFMEMIRRIIDGNADTVVFFEVPNAMFTLKQSGIWDLIYEHCSYFTAPSLSVLFREAGFTPLSVAEAFGGQYICIEARPSVGGQNFKLAPQKASVAEVAQHVRGFADNYRQRVSQWADRLNAMARSGIRPVVWGAGSKGITFLNVLKGAGRIDYVVDLNPRKQGKYVPGSGQQVVAPDLLAEIRPEAVIVMNPVYLDEIRKMVAERQPGGGANVRVIPV